MRYTCKTKIEDLRNNHDLLIGWGAASNEFERRYNPSYYKLDYMIDADNSKRGDKVCGIRIDSKDILKDFKGKKICFVLFPNLEQEIIEQITEYIGEFDSIVARLVEFDDPLVVRSYSENGEDVVITDLLNKLGISRPYYVDLGVCHPVIRNNTYMLYEMGFRDGILIEPNLDMCELAKEYRDDNIIVPMGAGDGDGGSMKYYMHHIKSYRGHNTFLYEEALAQGFADNYIEVPVKNINDIMEDYCDRVPDLLDIDTEGMDAKLLKSIDVDKFRIKVICAEEEYSGNTSKLRQILRGKGYTHYMSVGLNGIYIANELCF